MKTISTKRQSMAEFAMKSRKRKDMIINTMLALIIAFIAGLLIMTII